MGEQLFLKNGIKVTYHECSSGTHKGITSWLLAKQRCLRVGDGCWQMYAGPGPAGRGLQPSATPMMPLQTKSAHSDKSSMKRGAGHTSAAWCESPAHLLGRPESPSSISMTSDGMYMSTKRITLSPLKEDTPFACTWLHVNNHSSPFKPYPDAEPCDDGHARQNANAPACTVVNASRFIFRQHCAIC